MDFPFIRHFGKDYQRVSEYGSANKFRVIGDIVAVKPLDNLNGSNQDCEFVLDAGIWDKLPWSGWRVNKSGYVSCCNVPLHQVVMYLNGLEFKRDTVIDHKNRNPLDNRLVNLRPCTAIENGWNNMRKHGHQLKNGKWRFTFSKSFHTTAAAEDGLRSGEFQYMSKNRTCFVNETFDTYEEGWQWWMFKAGIHYGEYSPFANPYQSCEDIIKEASRRIGCSKPQGHS